MTFTTEAAHRIAKEAGMVMPSWHYKAFTRALNLAAAEALEKVVHGMDINQMWVGFAELTDTADKYRAAAQINQGESK